MKKLFAGLFALSLAFVFVSAGTALAGGDAAKGEVIFKKGTAKVALNGKKVNNKCKTCHKLTEKKKVGPGLKGVTKRRSEAWLVKWLSDPQKTWKENDKETQDLKKWKKGRDKKPKTAMKIKLTSEQVADVIAFLKKNDG